MLVSFFQIFVAVKLHKMTMLDQRDREQLRDRGISPGTIEKQIENFIRGFPFARLDRPATPGDGIFSFNNEERTHYEQVFNDRIAGHRPVKFVPASGAASRMFKKLFEFNDGCANDGSVNELVQNIEKIAFYRELDKAVKKATGKDIATLKVTGEYKPIIEAILSESGLNYAKLPKGLLLFHSYPGGSRTAAEEHLVEAAHYAKSSEGIARIHFTISPEHRLKFKELFETVTPALEQKLGVRFDISLSEQKPSTDTLAVDEENNPFRNPDGTLLFRPGGHGALISNLNDIDGDIIFIKNIDNIVPDRLKPETYLYKKVLGGYLLWMKQKVHGFLANLENNSVSAEEITGMTGWMRSNLFIDVPEGFEVLSSEEQINLLFSMLNRPMRVCGMVKNEGEPGGGPFWVRGTDGSLSLQIIESSQIDPGDSRQKSVLAASTHFNPVDLVCCTRDFKGNTFDLGTFVDPETGFITTKSSGGKILKAQELPGLWNGAMAKWITAFVEVPVATFNPVKTVNDLLRDEHVG
jgi:hypothetical protein